MLMSIKNALVTGGSRGIGAAIALALAKNDVNVAITYRSDINSAKNILEKIQSEGGNAIAIKCDQENPSEIYDSICEINKCFGKIDILVNNAAMAQEKPFLEITNENWDEVLAVNLRAPFIWCRELIPDMIESGWGRIINISSIGGQWGGYNQVHYAASKAALINLTKSVAKIYGCYGITSNAVAPGLVNTNMAANELDTDAGRKKVESIPVGRIAEPDEIASIVSFLSSDDAAYITGQTINVNGGMYFG